jgi:hypothetical protein
MYRRLRLLTALILISVAHFLPPAMAESQQAGNCRVKAVKDVYLEVYYSRGHRKAETIRHKSEMMWSGTLARGGMVPVASSNGWVQLVYQDLTVDDPRSENEKQQCQGGRTILIPR